MTQTTELSSLPVELVYKILGFLNLPDIVRFSRCSTHCNAVSFAGDPSTFSTIDLYSAQLTDPGVDFSKFNDASLERLLKVEPLRKGLKSIRLDYCQGISLHSFKLLLTSCPNLTHISLNACHGVQFDTRYLGALIRRLRYNDGWEGEGSDNVLPASEIPRNLKKVGLWGTLVKSPTGQIRAFELMWRTIVDQLLVARWGLE